MCLLIVLAGVVPGAPLVIGANRDEWLDRPAEPMAVLRASDPRTIGGRDLRAGGTWLAANEHGVVAGLTNRPQLDGADPARRSRGELPLALTTHRSAAAAASAFVETHDPADYNPAWLLVGDRASLHAIDLTGERAVARELPSGVHVLENRPLGEPSDKLDRVRSLLEVLPIEQVLADHEVPPLPPDAPDDEHREVRQAVGAVCVHAPGYGTRWSGVVTVPDAGPPTFRYADGPPCTTAYEVAAS